MSRILAGRTLAGRVCMSCAVLFCFSIAAIGQDASTDVTEVVQDENSQDDASQDDASQDDTGGTQAEDLQSLIDKASYAIGFNFGSEVSNEDFGLNVEMVIRGIVDASAGRDHILSDEEIITVMQAFQAEIEARQRAEFEALAEANKAEGATYMAANAEKEGVQTLENGLQYRVITAGEGASPTKESFVKVHYRGTFPNGEEFDSSIARGEPATFNVSGVIRGWTEILPLMQVGATWEVTIPGELAYGADPNFLPPDIGPNQVLVFQIELLEIVE